MAIDRGTTSIWLAKEKYKLFALTCKKFGFRISEILEAFMDEFASRYPLEDPDEMKYIQAPIFTPLKTLTPHVREDYQKGLMNWLSVFVCTDPECGAMRYIKPTGMKLLEKEGMQPSCLKCGTYNMELKEATP